MSPEAVTNRLKTMEQLWELSVNLMQAQEISETDLLAEKSLERTRNIPREQPAQKHLADIPAIK